jgi:NAD(P)-dependent dehydrogenase (short-subunit alcohol dehydrogenase family)
MRWWRKSQRDHGAIDILVNAVGGSTVIANPQATTEQLAFADWQKLIAFNLDGTSCSPMR